MNCAGKFKDQDGMGCFHLYICSVMFIKPLLCICPGDRNLNTKIHSPYSQNLQSYSLPMHTQFLMTLNADTVIKQFRCQWEISVKTYNINFSSSTVNLEYQKKPECSGLTNALQLHRHEMIDNQKNVTMVPCCSCRNLCYTEDVTYILLF